MDSDTFLSRCLRFDLETDERGHIYALAARWAGGQFNLSSLATRRDLPSALRQLERAAADCEFLLGHNLLRHDLEVLRAAAPGLALLDKPAVDTLLLSPLAFPENPYHRLVKGYKLVRDMLNDPLADVRLCERLFRDQWDAFATLVTQRSTLPELYRHCFTATGRGGIARMFQALDPTQALTLAPTLARTLTQAPAATADPAATSTEPAGRPLAALLAGRACRSALRGQLAQWRTTPGPELAYAASWLQVAGGNSVLPP